MNLLAASEALEREEHGTDAFKQWKRIKSHFALHKKFIKKRENEAAAENIFCAPTRESTEMHKSAESIFLHIQLRFIC